MRIASAVAVFLLGTSPAQRTAAAQPPQLVAIENVDVITMSDPAVLRGRTVVVDNGVIRAIGSAGEVTVPTGAQRVDGTDRYMIPGLTDAHIHILDVNDLPQLLTYGVTSVINMGGNPLVLEWRDRIQEGSLRGPDLFTTGPQIKPQPHPLVDFVVGLRDPAYAATIVSDQVAAGYDLVKIWGDHDAASFSAVLRAADSLDIRVTGHLSENVPLADAVSLGQSSIAHIEEYVNEFFNRQLDTARIPIAVSETRRGNVTVITTLATYDMIVRAAFARDDDAFTARAGFESLDPVRQLLWRSPYNVYRSPRYNARRDYYVDALAFQKRIAVDFHRAGITLLAGTDAGILPGLVPGLEIHRELELLVDAGLSPMQALASATRNAGEYLRGTPAFGTIATGMRANMVILNANPLDDITATRDIHAVIARGELITRAGLDRIRATSRQRNARTAEFVERVMSQGGSAAVTFADSVQSTTGQPAFEPGPALLLGASLAEAGRTDDAITVTAATARYWPDNYLPAYILGRLRLLTGDLEGARRDFLRVLELVPDHPAARRSLAEAGG